MGYSRGLLGTLGFFSLDLPYLCYVMIIIVMGLHSNGATCSWISLNDVFGFLYSMVPFENDSGRFVVCQLKFKSGTSGRFLWHVFVYPFIHKSQVFLPL